MLAVKAPTPKGSYEMGKMYRKGKLVTDLITLWELLDNGHWVFWKDKPVHPSIISSMQLRTVAHAIEMNRIHETEIRKAWYKQQCKST